MKKYLFILIAIPFAVACNNDAKDTVNTADSANEERRENAGENKTVVVDNESSEFLVRAANDGMAEVKLGELAQQKATSQQVKDFAAKMVQEHTAANNQVKALASQKNIVLPDSISGSHRETYDDLAKKTGKDFDKAYMSKMVDAHNDAVKLFETAIDDAKDTDINSFANKTLATLKAHHEHAKSVKDALK